MYLLFFCQIRFPTYTTHPTNVDLMLAHRLRRWANIKPALGGCLVFAGNAHSRVDIHLEMGIAEVLFTSSSRRAHSHSSDSLSFH